MPLDSRVIAAIILMGAAAIVGKLFDLWAWHKDQRPIIDTSTNGGVSYQSTTYKRNPDTLEDEWMAI